jgi:hypothetical protein
LLAQRYYAADEFLALIVLRVGFAGKDELDLTLGVAEDAPQTVGVGHDQHRPFVGGEAVGEDDDQRFALQGLAGLA